MSKDAHLYGIPRRASKPVKKELASSSDLAFSSALTSLISSSAASSAPRAKRPRGKDDIFTTHNANTKKRALADEIALQNDDPSAKARWKGKDVPMDDVSWRRTKRKMEEKSRLYAAMKRGDVLDDGEDDNPRHLVDFDKKWAENDGDALSQGDDDDDDDDDEESEEELVEFVDGFGRTRKGTKGEAAREQRRKQTVDMLGDEDSARPNRPSNIIFGDTIQVSAFDPDEPIAAQMAELAKKRDREATPPEAVHYDADAEIRSRGTGFFQFSKDEEVRKLQMENLDKERKETERARAEKEHDSRKEERKKAIEERRRMIKEKRGQVQAARFLKELESETISDGKDETQPLVTTE